MSDDDLEKIRLKKEEMLFIFQQKTKDIINISDEDDFKRLIKEFPDMIFLIDFWADWCAPCKLYTPIFERAQQEFGKDYIFVKINIDENPKIAQDFGITSIPTTLIIKENQLLRKFVGVVNFDSLKQILEKFKFSK